MDAFQLHKQSGEGHAGWLALSRTLDDSISETESPASSGLNEEWGIRAQADPVLDALPNWPTRSGMGLLVPTRFRPLADFHRSARFRTNRTRMQ